NHDDAVAGLRPREMERELSKQFGNGFRIRVADQFVIVYNTEPAYARWVEGVYKRLYREFVNHWRDKRGFPVVSVNKPLVTVIYRTQAEYAEHVRRELGHDPGNMVAYYNLLTNRVIMYDLTALFRTPGMALDNDRQINQILGNPNAIAMVTTIVHEATHQLIFNTGMQTRLADTPLWLNEGLAMYFETPDLNNAAGWRSAGKVNHVRLMRLRQYLHSRQPNSLRIMLSDDSVFREGEQMLDRYAEAWGFCYFLLNRKGPAFIEYLKYLSAKQPLMADTAEERVQEFQTFLGDDLDKLDAEFVEFISRLTR
ncbi:MAG TPA: DUF1570 domain-containing protein, partial [Pirellulaceae bacterium]|nr:DUF1570 domain-containing protein [Pirellulaceae bacterium]